MVWSGLGEVGHNESMKPAISADDALQSLMDGHERFPRGEACFPTLQRDVLASLTKGQQPFATVLGCSDSRVPPELIFDAGLGELFVVRVAGNVMSAEVAGSIHLRRDQSGVGDEVSGSPTAFEDSGPD